MNNFYLRFNHQIWQNPDLSLEEKLIVNLVWNFQIKAGYCYASDDYIAEVFGMRTDQVYLLIAELLSKKHIKILEEEPRRLMGINTKLYDLGE